MQHPRNELAARSVQSYAFVITGTWAYSAPEVRINRQRYTKKVDAWSLGVITFVLLSGYRECSPTLCNVALHYSLALRASCFCLHPARFALLVPAHDATPFAPADPFDPDGVAPEEELQRNIRYGTVRTQPAASTVFCHEHAFSCSLTLTTQRGSECQLRQRTWSGVCW